MLRNFLLTLLIVVCVCMAAFIVYDKMGPAGGLDIRAMFAGVIPSAKPSSKSGGAAHKVQASSVAPAAVVAPLQKTASEKTPALVGAASPVPTLEPTPVAKPSPSPAPIADAPEKKPDVSTEVVSTTEKEEDSSSKAQERVVEEAHIQIYEPAKPKPLGVLPEGWQLKVIPDQKAVTLPIPLPNGRVAEATSLPYVLEPSGEEGSYVLQEPGYDPEKRGASETIGKILSDQSTVMEVNNFRLKAVIGQLRSAIEHTGDPAHAAASRQKQVDVSANGKASPSPSPISAGGVPAAVLSTKR